MSIFSPSPSHSSSRSASGLNRARVSSNTSLKSHSSDMREGTEQDNNGREGAEQDNNGRDGAMSPFLLDVPAELRI